MTTTNSPTRNTIDRLKLLRQARADGYEDLAYTTDPAWLVNMAINRRAGWPDDPSTTRGSAMPLPDGRYPPRASGQAWRNTGHIANKVRIPRLILHIGELGAWRDELLVRFPERFDDEEKPMPAWYNPYDHEACSLNRQLASRLRLRRKLRRLARGQTFVFDVPRSTD